MKINLFKFGWLLLLILTFFTLVTLIFSLVVPMNFYVTLRGRIEPAKVLTVSFPEDGVLAFSMSRKTFKKGEVLARLNSITEQQLLEGYKKRLELLKKMHAAKIQNIEHEKEKWKLEREKHSLTLNNIKEEIPLQNSQFKMFSKISESLHSQKKLDEDLKKQEAEIFEYLYKRKLVAKLDFLKVLHDKKVATIMSEQAKAQAAEKLFDYKIELKKLSLNSDLQNLELLFYDKGMPPDTSLLSVEIEIEVLKSQILTLERKIENKTFRAPYDGIILFNSAIRSEFSPKGRVIMQIACSSGTLFRCRSNQFSRTEVEKGQKAEVYLDNYPFIKYGFIDASLIDIQTNLSATDAPYLLSLSMDVPLKKYPPGLTGKAKIIIFHGTILSYLLRD